MCSHQIKTPTQAIREKRRASGDNDAAYLHPCPDCINFPPSKTVTETKKMRALALIAQCLPAAVPYVLSAGAPFLSRPQSPGSCAVCLSPTSQRKPSLPLHLDPSGWSENENAPARRKRQHAKRRKRSEQRQEEAEMRQRQRGSRDEVPGRPPPPPTGRRRGRPFQWLGT